MEATTLGKRKSPPHPYLSGNFAPIQRTCPLTPCSFTGSIPKELLGGQYVRNGGNPVLNEDMGRDAHWFDGDGMLSGLLFKRKGGDDDTVQPEFVNQYILTDLFMSTVTTPSLRKPILPSIATLVNPLSSLLRICLSIFRAILIVILSRLPGSEKSIKKISVANTSIMYHDGRALATCESGPPMRIRLPSLDTVGWFDGNRAEGEPANDEKHTEILGEGGFLHFMKEWTTAHPKVDPNTKEMMLFHSMFLPPFVHYTIIPATQCATKNATPQRKLINAPVAGVSSAKMMHDFGVSAMHTVIMDLPLTLDPLQLANNTPPITYDSSKPSRFGVFPRHEPSNVRWYQTSACCIFHTVNTWDVCNKQGALESVDMLTCRMTSATLVFSAGNIAAPQPSASTVAHVKAAVAKDFPYAPSESADSFAYEKGPALESPGVERTSLLWDPNHTDFGTISEDLPVEEEQCRLYYYSFDMSSNPSDPITHQWALSAIPFEFPSVRADVEMSAARYVYGCTTTCGGFNSALGRAAKVDALVKIDVQTLISRGKAQPPARVTGCVDKRSVAHIIACSSQHKYDPIQVFQTPPTMYAQEPRFVPSLSSPEEDAGFLLTYMFNEEQLTSEGDPPSWAVSELWIIDARNMKDVLARVTLPQRVPYGLHGSWFSEEEVMGQRPVENTRQLNNEKEKGSDWKAAWGRKITSGVVKAIGG